MKQYEQVIDVMEKNGGFATLEYLNHHVDYSNWLTKTPFASIRRIVQVRKEFFKIKPGLWALIDYQDQLLKDSYILKKTVDWSVLKEGFTIPLDLHSGFYNQIKKELKHGEKTPIQIIFNNKVMTATLINQNFNRQLNPRHKDILQIRYTTEVSNELRAIFYKTFNLLKLMKEEKQFSDKSILKIPDEIKEYLIVYGTEDKRIFHFDSITMSELDKYKQNIKDNRINEVELETFFNKSDENSGFYYKNEFRKIRRLNKSIGNELKKLYTNKCQICGKDFGYNYNAKIVECHHIVPFVKSLNNDSSNLLIICPNHHRIIHKVHPEFDLNSLSFLYSNGLTEKLSINYHL